MNYLEQARIDVATVAAAMQAAWTAYPLLIEMDNRTVVDLTTQTNPYLCIEVVPIFGAQADMADKPLVKQLGQILISAVAREGSGQSASNLLLDFATSYFDLKSLTLIQCRAAEGVKPKRYQGWWWSSCIVNYYYFRFPLCLHGFLYNIDFKL